MIPYILYASLILTACLIFYKLLLQKETFFYLNRFVLLACMVLAFVLPVLQVPQQISFRKVPASVNISSQKPAINQDNTTYPAASNVHTSVVEPVQKRLMINFEKVMHW